MKLIDEIIDYCYENGLIDRTAFLEAKKNGITSLKIDEADSLEMVEDDFSLFSEYNEEETEPNHLDQVELELENPRPPAKSSRQKRNRKNITAPLLSDKMAEMIQSILEDPDCSRFLFAFAAQWNKKSSPSAINERELSDLLHTIFHTEDDLLFRILADQIEDRKKRISLSQIYRFLAFCENLFRQILLLPLMYKGPALRSFLALLKLTWNDPVGKHGWLLKDDRLKTLYYFNLFRVRIRKLVLNLFQTDPYRFEKWSSGFGAITPEQMMINSSLDGLSLYIFDFLKGSTFKDTLEKFGRTIQFSEKYEDAKYCAWLLNIPCLADQKLTIEIKGIDYTFCWCPPGSFKMGNPESENGRSSSEILHIVRISRGFLMLETPVTQEMYESLMGTNPSYFSSAGEGKDQVSGSAAKYPVEQVSWYNAKDFCEKWSELSRYKCCLPTEAQWEYGGSGILDEMGWYGGNSGYRTYGTYEVKTKKANAWGLYDMHGNVWEWCSDLYDGVYYKNSPTTDPTGPSSGSDRVNRGGGWCYNAKYCRSAYRGSNSPTGCYGSVGFRLALSSLEE
ncbi:MAG: formylglycine-generating enzyme family protein [Planctomycetia bacterium]|nr:formylglycine-generating enzyme family protein [Planctomycetia bacterium]